VTSSPQKREVRKVNVENKNCPIVNDPLRTPISDLKGSMAKHIDLKIIVLAGALLLGACVATPGFAQSNVPPTPPTSASDASGSSKVVGPEVREAQERYDKRRAQWGQLFRVVEPTYPGSALKEKIAGTVFATIVVTAGGQVKAMRAINSEPKNESFERSFARAAAAWRFHPALGEKCAAPDRDVEVRVDFEVRDEKPFFTISLVRQPQPPAWATFDEAQRPRFLDWKAISARISESYPKQNRIDGVEAVIAVEYTVQPGSDMIENPRAIYVDAYHDPVTLIRRNKLVPLALVPTGPVEAPVPVRVGNAMLFQRAIERVLDGAKVKKSERATPLTACLTMNYIIQGESSR
jgi:TonB family protein